MKIRTNDEVLVITGKDKGKRGRVLKVSRDRTKIVVEGVNVIVRHLRRNPQNPQAGGRVHRPAPLPVSNVMLWSPAEERGVRVRYEGKRRSKHRVSSTTGQPITAAGTRKARKAGKKATEQGS